jgi:hypothetical protein
MIQLDVHNVLLLIVLPAFAAQVITADQAVNNAASSSDIAPQPIVVPPSQYCKLTRHCTTKGSRLIQSLGDGIDGLWSTFALRVGTPAQDVRVIVSTNAPQSMVVLPLGCTSDAINPVPSDCANARGGLFNPNSSSTWLNQGLFGINENGVGFEANLGYSQPSQYGLETLGLGYVAGEANGPTLKNQTVAGIATASPFYLYVPMHPHALQWHGSLLRPVELLHWEHNLSITPQSGISLRRPTLRASDPSSSSLV